MKRKTDNLQIFDQTHHFNRPQTCSMLCRQQKYTFELSLCLLLLTLELGFSDLLLLIFELLLLLLGLELVASCSSRSFSLWLDRDELACSLGRRRRSGLELVDEALLGRLEMDGDLDFGWLVGERG